MIVGKEVNVLSKHPLFGAFCLSLAASIWGGTYVVSKYVLDEIPPFTLMWLRYAIGFLALFLVHRMQGGVKLKEMTTRDVGLLTWIGFIGYFVSIALQFVGTKWSDAHTGALVTSATPAFIFVFAYFLLRERFTRRKTIALLLATTGVLIVVGLGKGGEAHLLGGILLIGAAVTWALLSVYAKIASDRFSSLAITMYAILAALLFTTPVMLYELKDGFVMPSAGALAGVVFLGLFSTAAAFLLWNAGMKMMDAGIGSLFFFFQPLVGALLGWWWLDETLDLSFFLGGTLIIVGVLVATYRKTKSTSGIQAKKRSS